MNTHASAAPHDFDFIIGDWLVTHRRLNARLADSGEWTQFEGWSSTRKILGGFGNLEDNILHLPGEPYRAAAMRSYCCRSGTWSIWWLDGRHPTQLDKPVVGKFTGHLGLFYADDELDGLPVKVRFTWNCASSERPRWEQAFFDNGGTSWETNWVMEFRPDLSAKPPGSP